MSYQEKRSVMSIITSVLVLTIYSIVMYQRFQNGNAETGDLVKYWATFIVILIPFSVLGRIIVEIFFHIGNEVAGAAKGEKPESIDIVDERDKLIEVKSASNSLYIFMIGFLIAMLTQVFGMGVSVMFIVLIAGGFLSDVGSSLLGIYYYRKGV